MSRPVCQVESFTARAESARVVVTLAVSNGVAWDFVLDDARTNQAMRELIDAACKAEREKKEGCA